MKTLVLRDWQGNEIYAIFTLKKEVDKEKINGIIREVKNDFPEDWTIGDIEERLVEKLDVDNIIYLENEENFYI